MRFIRKHWLILLLVIISLFLRLYRIGATMTFLEDEGRDLLIVKRMIDTHIPVLLGPQTSTGSMYLGPLYYYFITPALFLAQMNPVGPAVLIALSGGLTTYLLFVLGKRWFGNKAGYLASLLFAILPFSVSVTRASWNPNLIPLISVLMLMVFDHLIGKSPKLKDWLFFGILVGVMVQLHYMALVFVGALSLAILWFRVKDFRKFILGVGLSLVGFFLTLTPFIFFELRNDWVNTKAITRFMEAKQDRNIRYDLPLWLWWDKVGKTSYRLIGNTLVGSELGNAKSAPVAVTGFVVIFLLALTSAIKKREKLFVSLSLVFLISLSVLGIYQENIHMHYLEFGIPLIILILVGSLSNTPSRLLRALGAFLIAFILATGLPHTIEYISSGSTHQVEKAKVVAEYIASRAGDRPYNLVSSPLTNTSPYQYFAFTTANPPKNSAEPLVFMVCQDAPCTSDDIHSPLIFIHGPSHPSLDNYVGHPLAAYVAETPELISNDHVSYGIWVAELMLK